MRLDKILNLLGELHSFCERYNETAWKDEIERRIGELHPCLKHETRECEEKVFDMRQFMFGRGLALQDLAILKSNGHNVEDELQANTTLENIRRRLKQTLDVELEDRQT